VNKNITALKSNHIFLKEKFSQEIKKTDWFFIDDDGFSIRTDSNEVVRGNAKESPEVVVNQYGFHEDEATVIFGISDGALLHAVCQKKHKKHIVIVYETQLDIIQYACDNYDFSKWLKNGTLLLISSKENDEIDSVVAVTDSANLIQDWVLLAEPYAINKPSVYGEQIRKIQALINHLRCNTGTVMQAGSIIAKNDLENIPYIIRHHGISVLKDKFAGKTAVLVSTGPSLSKNIHYLKSVQDKVIIVAVGQALRILLAYDIRPDFICTVDFGEVNFTHFKGLMDSDVPMVALNRTYAPLLKEWRGPKFISTTYNAECDKDTITNILDGFDHLEQGGSVAHFGFSFALYMGCSTVIIIGKLFNV